MNTERLVKMANEIAVFYETDAPADAPKNIASHLKRFWEPRMRKEIVEHLKTGGAGLKDVVRQALALLA